MRPHPATSAVRSTALIAQKPAPETRVYGSHPDAVCAAHCAAYVSGCVLADAIVSARRRRALRLIRIDRGL